MDFRRQGTLMSDSSRPIGKIARHCRSRTAPGGNSMTHLTRRTALCSAVVALIAWGPVSQAQTRYPDKPVRIILPYGPGGVADVTTRLVAQKLSERMGQNFYIENRPGAGGVVAAKVALAAPADGYTLFLTGNGSAINESLFKSPPYNALTDFSAIGMLAEFEMLLVTKADSKLDTVEKIVTYGKENPGKLNFGAINVGSTQNLSAELFRMTTGIKATLVTYRTTPELVTAIVRGDVDVGFDYLAPLRPMINGKQIKVIATSGDHPDPQLPSVPIVKTSYPDYVVTSWNALSGPAGIPKDVIGKLNGEINAVLNLPEVKERMATLGMEPAPVSPEQMNARMKHDIEKWRVVIDKAGIPKQ
jgi:putative tricarboxylic transport membrane protein